MRPDSKQLVIMKALTTHLEGINPTNDDPATDPLAPFDLDLRGKVKRGRTVFGRETVMPFLSILESPQPLPVDGVGYAKTRRKEYWQLLVQGFVADDKDNPTDAAYDLKAVVEMRLARIIAVDAASDAPTYPDEYLLGGLIYELTVGQSVARPPDDKVSSGAFFYIPLTVALTTNILNPFST